MRQQCSRYVSLLRSPTPAFAADCCRSCPLAAACPTRLLANGDRQLRRAPATLATARRQIEQQEPAFKERYRIRSGIESTNRELKHRHGLAMPRARGRPEGRGLAVPQDDGSECQASGPLSPEPAACTAY
ncbi:MAG: hypothetical protein FJ125_10255, partial [Deltaproteobacteria bacterium]|nr:hypothetical protein [Deltaproteobacteria bacterium]